MNIYIKGLQFCINQAWRRKIVNNIELHPFVYKSLRKRGLQSQLAIACIKQATGMVKKAKTKPVVFKQAMRYNFPRSASLKNNILSIATVKGRQKFDINIADYFSKYANWKIVESMLIIDRKGRCFFCLSKAKDIPIKKRSGKLGIDVGINNVAVTSSRQFFNARQIKLKKIRFLKLRSKLQAKGTKSAKRLLKRISGREKRFMAYWNHIISKQIVSDCKVGTIVLEDLKNIRKQRKGKRFNFWLNNWSFYQLQSFIRYKSEREGIKVIKVSPYMTSQTCSRCGSIGSRSKGFFCCSHCNYSLNADLNASFNLAKHHSKSDDVMVAITQPNSLNYDVKGTIGAIATEFRAN